MKEVRLKERIVTLFDTRDEAYNYENYVKYCKEEGSTPADENSDDYYNWVEFKKDFDLEVLLTNLTYSKMNEEPVIITGTLGMWNGMKSIYPMLVESENYEPNQGKGRFMNPAIVKAIYKCINGMDDFKIEHINGSIIVYGYHHDGTNTLRINKLSKKGKITALNAHKKGKTIDIKSYTFGAIRSTDIA